MDSGMKYGAGLDPAARLARLEQRYAFAAAPSLASWRTIMRASSAMAASVGAAQRVFSYSNSLVTSTSAQSPRIFYIEDSDMLDLDGYSCEIRVIGTVHTNTTAPGVNFTFGVTSIAAAAAGAGLSGWTLGGSPIATAVVTAPGAASIVSTVGSTASGFSTDGPYALYVTNSGSTAASSFQGIHIEVQMRWIPT